MADQFAYTPEIIQENREMLSQAHLDSIIDNFPLMELNKGLYTSHPIPSKNNFCSFSVQGFFICFSFGFG